MVLLMVNTNIQNRAISFNYSPGADQSVQFGPFDVHLNIK